MALSDNLRGALLMMGSMAAFTVNDAFMKSLAGDAPLYQLLFLRGILATSLIGVLALSQRAFTASIPRRDIYLILGRVVAEIGAAYYFLTALFNMPLANLTAILQALPLTVTLAAAVIFREKIGWRRMTAILVGFTGVLLIVRPGTEGFNIFSLYALVSVAFVTARDLFTRRLSGATPSLLVTFSTSVSVMLAFGIASLWQEWQPIPFDIGWRIVGAGGMVTLGYLFSVLAMRVGEIGFVAPFRYTSLIWALILGFAIFGDWPQILTLIGAAIVTASGLFTLWRERQLARSKRGGGGH
jgi:drug/metabolite transporter (DMT)-like permease